MDALPFVEVDTAAVARSLAQLLDRPDDRCDAFFEHLEAVELPEDDVHTGVRIWREQGLAIRLVRGSESWLASRDRLDAATFEDALRRVARAMPRARYPLPGLHAPSWRRPVEATEVLAFPAAVHRAIRTRQARFSFRLRVKRIRRALQVIGPRVASPIERETFYAVTAELPWGHHGCLLTTLDHRAADFVARDLVRAFHCHEAPPPAAGKRCCVLGQSATAVLLHEAVAHALEADTLALGGHPEAAVGVRLTEAGLTVLDDPTSAPVPIRRSVDDEGTPVVRRFLLRDGVVEQPLCDNDWASTSDVLAAGAGRRGNRHDHPAPRSSHLELLPGELSHEELLTDADGGLYLPVAGRGHLDPLAGTFTLELPYGRQIRNHAVGEPAGPCRLRGHVGDLLQAVRGVGRDVQAAGAGWCAKGGMKLPVWATVPPLRLENVTIET